MYNQPISIETAARIRRAYDDGASICDLMRDFETARPTITRIIDDRTHREPPGPYLPSSLHRDALPEWQPCHLDCAAAANRLMALAARTVGWDAER